MTAVLPKYTLTEIHQIGANGFQFEIPENVILAINRISNEITREPCIRNPNFNSNTISYFAKNTNSNANSNLNAIGFKGKRRKNNNREASDDEWKSAPFQATKIERNVGIDANIDKIRLYLNKISDRTYLQIKDDILAELVIIYDNELTEEENNKVCNTLYDFSSSNKFYSRICAEMYSELVTRYSPIRLHFQLKMQFENMVSIYNDVNYIDPDTDYDGFCNNNKLNEKRRSNSQFYVNLAINGLITNEHIAKILAYLLNIVMIRSQENGNKHLVDELIENIAILYKPDMLSTINEDEDQFMIQDETITDYINILANAKSKDYKSLTNKSIFKLMDLIES